MMKTKAPGLTLSLGGFVLKKERVAGIVPATISSESDRHCYGFRRNRLDRHRDLRGPWLR
jgi:hypothetical protein